MTKQELDNIIEKIEHENAKDKAFFGIHLLGGDFDSAYIKANTLGLELFATELLKASRNAESVANSSEKNEISIDNKDEWITGDFSISHIQVKSEDRIDVKPEPEQKSWRDRIFNLGCFLIIGIIVIVLIVGLISIINWLY